MFPSAPGSSDRTLNDRVAKQIYQFWGSSTTGLMAAIGMAVEGTCKSNSWMIV